MPKKSRSASPAKKSAASMVTADLAIAAFCLWWFAIFLVGLVVPAKLIEMYEVPLEDLKAKNEDYTLVLMTMQNWCLWGIGMTMPGFVVRRTGTQKTKSLLCGALFLCGLVLFGVGEWKSYPLLAELKMPDKGAHMNRAINVIQCTLLALGWKSSGSAIPDVKAFYAPTASMSAGALCYNAYLCALFGLMMLFNLDALFEGYGFESEGLLKKWVAMIFSGMAQALVSSAIISLFMLGADKTTTGGLMRSQWCFYSMTFTMGCMASTLSMNYACPTMPVEGQYFNMGLWVVGGVLPFKAMTGKFPLMN